MKSVFIKRGRRLLFVPLLGLVLAGCHSPNGSPAPYLAAVNIKDKSREEIEVVTQTFFEDLGYRTARAKSGELMFDKEGTGMNTFVYGDWSTKKIWVRVKVFLVEMKPEQQIRLACDAFMVGEHGDPHFEEEHKLTRIHRGTYQDMLNKISQKLQQTPTKSRTARFPAEKGAAARSESGPYHESVIAPGW